METEELPSDGEDSGEQTGLAATATTLTERMATVALERANPTHFSSCTTAPSRTCWVSVPLTGTTVTAASWSEAQARHRRLWPATAAIHLVPDIVVEHVSSSVFSGHTSRQHPPTSHSLSPQVEATSVGRQVRALSDSTVYEMEKSMSPVKVSPPRSCSSYSSQSPELLDLSTSAVPSVALPPPDVRRSSHLEQTFGTPHVYLGSDSPSGGPYTGPEKTPKANWLRRHSDSNLASGEIWCGGLRLEPYPIRSHSTGDALSSASSDAHPLNPHQGRAQKQSEQMSVGVEQDIDPAYQHSKHYHALSSTSHLWQLPQHHSQSPGVFWPERIPVKKFSSEGSKRRSSFDRERQQIMFSGRCLSDKGPYASQPQTAVEVASHESSRNLEKSHRPVSTPMDSTAESDFSHYVPAQTEEILPQNLSLRKSTQHSKSSSESSEGAICSEKSTGLVEKRQKLKKYLQARYQLSLRQARTNSDTDDVFSERYCSPELAARLSPFTEASAHQPEDLSSRAETCGEPTFRHEPMMERVEFARKDYRLSESEEAQRASPRYRGMESSHILPMDEQITVKPEPMSPGIVPSGTSVFVFPPAMPSYSREFGVHSQNDWYRATFSTDSPLPSPIVTSSEQWRAAGQRHERSSYPGDSELSYRVRGLQQHLPPPPLVDISSLSAFDQPYSLTRSQMIDAKMSESTRTLSASESLPPTPRSAVTAAAGSSQSESWSDSSAQLRFGIAQPRSPSSMELRRLREVPRSQRLASLFADESGAFTCPVCSLSFPSYRHLTDHMSDHVSAASALPESGLESDSGVGSGGAKPVHLCPICQRAFSRGDMLTRHVRLHTGIRPYECNLCSQVFSRSDHLTTHQRTHTGEKPYRCPICAYAAPRRDMVTRHARIHESVSSHPGRRGRRTASISSPSVDSGRGARQMSAPSRQVAPARRLHSESTGFFQRRQWTAGDEEQPHRWSLASSVESTESSAATVGPSAPVTCRAWSTTSAESFESYPGAAPHSSSLSSVADSPDVFSVHPRYFRWGSELDPPDEDPSMESPTGGKTAAVDVACVMPALQKCSVASPPIDRQPPDPDTPN